MGAVYAGIVRPVLERLDPEDAHHLGVRGLALAQGPAAGRAVLRAIAGWVPPGPVEFCGLKFPNVLGVAAGFDKNAEVAPGLWELGFGHVEVGTLTPRPQAGNPRPRVFRLPADRAIINRMGFPNCGVQQALARLSRFHRGRGGRILGVSIGKQKETPLPRAAGDYIHVMRRVHPHCDYMAVNISSPNTPGLRELQGDAYLRGLLGALVRENGRLADRAGRRPPLLVKIAPDMRRAELCRLLDACIEARIDGVIATNTTLSRPPLRSPGAGEAGGLSGRPLRRRSTGVIRAIRAHAGDALPVIGVGGVLSARDATEKLEAGASLVQVYTGLVLGGPGWAGDLLRELSRPRGAP